MSILSAVDGSSSSCSVRGANWLRLAAGLECSSSGCGANEFVCAATVVQSVPSSYGSLSSSSVGCMAAALRLLAGGLVFGGALWLLVLLLLLSPDVSSRLLCLRRSRRLVKASSLLVWLEEVGVVGFWPVVVCLGGVAATAARVGRRMFSGNSGCCRMVLVVNMWVSGVFRK